MKWIKVEDRLPENHEFVLCVFREKYLGQWAVVNFYSEGAEQDKEWFKRVYTHWMPLPEPPKP